jgi:multidrug resistance efflux pump
MAQVQGNKIMANYKSSKLIALLFTAFFITACSESGNEGSTSSDTGAELEQLMHEAEQARIHADELGFEWSNTQSLLDEGHAAQKAGDHAKAHTLYQEAKLQSILAVEQAQYADQHWHLLDPSK